VDRIGLRLTGQRFASGGGGRRRARLSVLALLGLLAVCALLVATCAQARNHPKPAKHGSRWITLTNPIDPAQELKLPFGARSQWLQPWRGYLDTPPARDVTNGLGINFNVPAPQAEATAAALERAGFHRARVEIGWNTIDPNNTGSLSPAFAAQERTILGALFRHHVRPLILLNSNDGIPTALKDITLHVMVPAAAGTRTLILSPASADQVVPGHTGLDSLTGGNQDASLIVTGIHGVVATLSAPLPKTLGPGDYDSSTLAFQPFSDPRNPGFATTLAGWLSYVQAVAGLARSIGHGDGFDVEVWNELSFGSSFLNINNYYSPPVDPYAPASGSDSTTTNAILAATANLIHSHFPGVQVGDGFDDQIPWPNGKTQLPGVQIDKHYYQNARVFPRDNVVNGDFPVGPQGNIIARKTAVNGSFHWSDQFVPSYTADFPEYYLTGIQTETIIRDLTPLRSENIYRTPHGRFTHPPGAQPPKVWMTEYNLVPLQTFTPAQDQRFQAKVALRYLLSFISKGLGLVDFYAAKGVATGNSLGLIPNSFFASIASGHLAGPGLTLTALRRMSQDMKTSSRMHTRSVKLLQIATTDRRNVFNGRGPYPPLRNLDVAAFFPFQEATHRFVFAAYVMTRDLTRVWRRSGARKYDMPAAPYRFTVGNVNGCNTKLSALDPFNGTTVAVKRISCTKHTLTLQTELTDSPILIQANGA
jgi:hypothetical protein